MYAGTTFKHRSGNITGVHQRIDRVAKKQLVRCIGRDAFFPSIKTILHFEGKNGPDGIKSKSPSVDEPWHFISPDATTDDPLVKTIEDNLYNLSVALNNKDEVRAGYEAAWLSHAIVDGLTPAHHFPLAEKIEELWGKAHGLRDSTSDKIIIKGSGARDSLNKNWEYWGAKGIFSAHLFYEMGVASSLTVATFKDVGITDTDLARIEREGFVPYFMESIKQIDEMGTYQEFMRTGWSVHLANVSRKKLIPLIMKNVCLAWYAAYKRTV
jgi:hypothetical protein